MTKNFMQPTLIAGAVLALSAGMAQAQNSVTIYGIVDAGIQYTDKVNAAGASLTELNNGGRLPSIWGFKGSEDLGGGMKASFNLEGDFDSGNGAANRGGGTGLDRAPFSRQANVGLSGDFGSILLGRQYSVALLADLAVDPRGFKESLSSLSTYALTQVEINGSNTLGIFTSNAVSYSNAFGPVKVGLMYGFGEQAGDVEKARTMAIGVTYTGAVIVSGSYKEINASANKNFGTERLSLGIAVPMGNLTFKGYYANSTQNAAAGEVSEIDNYAVGVDYKWNAQNTLTVAYYEGDEKKAVGDGKTSNIILSNDYALSKRTTVYAQYAYIDRGIAAPGGTTVNFGASAAGEKASILGVGITHTF